jgi:hypothetical protein
MKTPREFLLNRHKSAESKLDRMCNETLAPEVRVERASLHPNLLIAIGCKLWRELVLPSRRIWAGLACAWLVIAVLNLASFEPATEVASQTKPPSHEEIRALIEQRQMLAQLIGPTLQPAEKHRRQSPGPQSERRVGTATA